jgi:hypothetical protein
MELTQDWISFQEMFYPRKRTRMSSQDARTPLYLIVEQGLIISAFAEGEDLSSWKGLPVQEATELHAYMAKDRKIVQFGRQDVDRWIEESTTKTGFYDQVEFLRQRAQPEAGVQFRPHFVIQAMHGWWGKVLPSAYGVYISVKPEGQAVPGSPQKHLLMLVRRGKFDQFHEPDLSSLKGERAFQPDQVVKYLSEKHLVPVQGVFVTAAEWQEWNDAAHTPHPWRKVTQSIKANRTQLVPFRWGVASLMATRAFL